MLDRRALLRLLAAFPAIAAGVSACGDETVPGPDAGPAGFLTDQERRSLGALADAVLPPDDLPGGDGLGAVAYIERALTAFDVSPPAIFAGGPYSGRAPFPDPSGAPSSSYPVDDFETFLPLDRYADAAWRLTILGSSGVPGGGPNDAVLGAVVGWRDQIRQGIAAAVQIAGQPLESLDAGALAAVYKELDSDFRDLLFTLVTQGALSAPEYGGNTGLAGWGLAHFEGDVMPYGYSQYDPATQSYRERPDAPVSMPNPGADPEPVTDDTWSFIRSIIVVLGGMEFPVILGNASLSQFDVLIIGSGAGGGPSAYLLTKFGLKVLILEAGPNHFDGLDDASRDPTSVFSNDELKLAHRSFIDSNSMVDPRTWRNSEADGDRTYVGGVQSLPKTVGGGALHADLKMPRFAPTDFQLGTLIGKQFTDASFADWPVTYDMLEPFYTYAEWALGVQGLMGANPFEGPRSKPFPMPPGVPMYLALKMGEGLKSLGYTAFPFPTAVNSQPYDGRPACVDCGFCSGYPCPTNAKGAPAVTMLRKALLSGNAQLHSETRVVKLLLNGAKNQVTGVQALGPDGEAITFTADRYVIAASPIEDARLLFLSDPSGVGNSSGMVGRNIMFHFQTGAVGVFAERLHGHRGRVVTHGFADFRGVPNDPNRPLGGIVEISGSEMPIDETEYIKRILDVTGFDGPRLKSLLRQSPFRDHVIALALQAEDAPQAKNRVDLDPAVRDLDGMPVPRVTYQNHAFELGARQFYAPLLIKTLGAAGAKFAAIGPPDTIPASAHIMGTLRFGADSQASVCDGTGRFHDVGNLYASDGSLFPTSSGFNPTMTIVALSCWVAGGMLFPGSPEKALT